MRVRVIVLSLAWCSASFIRLTGACRNHRVVLSERTASVQPTGGAVCFVSTRGRVKLQKKKRTQKDQIDYTKLQKWCSARFYNRFPSAGSKVAL